MNIKIEPLKNELSAKGVRPTYIRLKILDYLKKNMTHSTADMIYEALLKEIPTLSKMSVYNTLKMFSEKKICNENSVFSTSCSINCIWVKWIYRNFSSKAKNS